MKIVRRVALVVGLTAWVASVIACSGGGGGAGTDKTDRRPLEGEQGYLAMPSEGDIILATDEKAMDEMYAYARAKNDEAMKMLVASRRAFVVPHRTRITVVDAGFTTTTVRVMDGRHAGKAGIVPNEALHK